jgi:DNA-binding winged helix-turn-helix (wHTH) protein/pimeloyl-ACP methyl ester carboxylesterase
MDPSGRQRCPMIARFGDCELDIDRRELRRAIGPVHVEPQVFDLLVYLIANKDRVVSKDEVIQNVWHGRIVSEATLSSRINAVRQALGDDGRAQSLIRTVPRRGFRFIGDVRTEDRAATATGSVYPSRTGSELAANQEVTFCKTADGVRLAVASVGKGEVLIKTANWLNHVEYDWQSPVWAPTFARWAARHRLIRYDQRGTGLSDWDAVDVSLEAFVRDLEAVVDTLRVERFTLFGISQGAAVALAYAARNPERVSRLVLHGAYALGRTKRETNFDRERAEAYLTLIRHGWGHRNSAFMRAFSTLYLPSGTSEQITWFSELQRMTTSPENAIRIRIACDEIDILDLLSKVQAPTLITHSREDNVVPFDHGRLIATSIPGARFVGLQSDNHVVLPGEPAWEKFMCEMEQFLSVPV